MVRRIDMEWNVPRHARHAVEPACVRAASADAGNAPHGHAAERPAGYGMANYGRIFCSRREGDERPTMDMDADVAMLRTLGIERAVPFGISHDETADLRRADPDRFLGLARLSCLQGMRGGRARERLVRQDGWHALGVSALVDGLPASNRRDSPLSTKAAALGMPVRMYASMPYATDRPYDLGPPKHLDPVARDFPALPLIGGLGGWPWVNEMVALVRRHPHLYVDTAAHRAKYLGQPGAGWEMRMQFGNTLIQDKGLGGISAGLIGQPYATLIQEYLDLPLKDSVKAKWVDRHAARVFGLA